MSGLRQYRRDLLRVVRGLNTVFRHLWSNEDCAVGLGLFSAASNVAIKGEPSRYSVRIANTGCDPTDVMLMIDIWADKLLEPSTGHYASFIKRLTVQSGIARAIAIEYDWVAQAIFHIDGQASPPDDFWKGTVGAPQVYSVTALLRDPGGNRLDGLTVYQELTP